jgi:hypothetical protein
MIAHQVRTTEVDSKETNQDQGRRPQSPRSAAYGFLPADHGRELLPTTALGSL